MTKLEEIENLTTTFRQDFDIAEMFGTYAIRETAQRAIQEWQHDFRYFAHLVMTLNHKIWEWYETKKHIAKVYNDLWLNVDNLYPTLFKGEELTAIIRFLD